MADYMQFSDLYSEIEGIIRLPKASKRTMVKHIINMVYLNEMLMADDLFPLYWMVDFDDTLASVSPRTITGITQADPGIITVDAAHGLTANVDIVSIYGISGMTELNNRTFLVNTTPATTTLSLIDLDSLDAIDTSAFTAWSSGGTVHHRGKVIATTGKDVQRILDCMWHDEQRMKEIDRKELEDSTQWWGDNTSRPTRYMLRKKFKNDGSEIDQLLWFPSADDAYDLRYWVLTRGNKLINDTDVPLLPPQFHPGIVAGAVTRLAESKVQVEAGVIWPGIYRAHLDALRAFNRQWYKAQQIPQGKPFLL